jgi:hypothetical protein
MISVGCRLDGFRALNLRLRVNVILNRACALYMQRSSCALRGGQRRNTVEGWQGGIEDGPVI